MRMPLFGLALIALAGPALAATQADADGDGRLSWDEARAAYPDLTEDAFAAIDVNADGELDEEEVTAAREAGMMPMTES